MTLDPSRLVAFRGGRRLELSRKEFAVLECLLAVPGRVVSAEELLERAWDEAADPFTTAVKTTIRRLRAKLGDPPVIVALSALSLGAGWLIAGRFLRPLRTITATARNISASNLSRRVALGRRDDELAELRNA